MLDNKNWYRRHDGLHRFIAWLEAQPENTYECTTAKTAFSLDMQESSDKLGSLHPEGRIAMDLYCQIGSGDGRQCYAGALARAKYCQARPFFGEKLNPEIAL